MILLNVPCIGELGIRPKALKQLSYGLSLCGYSDIMIRKNTYNVLQRDRYQKLEPEPLIYLRQAVTHNYLAKSPAGYRIRPPAPHPIYGTNGPYDYYFLENDSFYIYENYRQAAQKLGFERYIIPENGKLDVELCNNENYEKISELAQHYIDLCTNNPKIKEEVMNLGRLNQKRLRCKLVSGYKESDYKKSPKKVAKSKVAKM